jgi:hypothetical protein
VQQTGTARKRMATEAPEDPAPRTTRRAAKASGIMAGASSDHAVPATPRTFHKDLPFTPAASKGQASVMGTCMRLPRRGESIMNARGSPMGVRETDASAQVNTPAAETVTTIQTTKARICIRGGGTFRRCWTTASMPSNDCCPCLVFLLALPKTFFSTPHGFD